MRTQLFGKIANYSMASSKNILGFLKSPTAQGIANGATFLGIPLTMIGYANFAAKGLKKSIEEKLDKNHNSQMKILNENHKEVMDKIKQLEKNAVYKEDIAGIQEVVNLVQNNPNGFWNKVSGSEIVREIIRHIVRGWLESFFGDTSEQNPIKVKQPKTKVPSKN